MISSDSKARDYYNFAHTAVEVRVIGRLLAIRPTRHRR